MQQAEDFLAESECLYELLQDLGGVPGVALRDERTDAGEDAQDVIDSVESCTDGGLSIQMICTFSIQIIFLVAFIALLATGPGRFSIDGLIRRK